MKRILFMISILFTCIGCGGDGQTYFSLELQQMLDSAVQSGVTGIGLYVITPDQGEGFISSGLADRQTQALLSENDRFRIASITKTFTAAGIMMLVDEGELGIEDTIDQFVPDLGIPQDTVITIQMLLNHTSGIHDSNNGDDNYVGMIEDKDPDHLFTPTELIAASVAQGLDFAPGTSFHYSDTNFVLLSVILERVSGISYKEFIQTRILTPFGLRDTVVLTGLEMEIPGSHAHGYYKEGDQLIDATELNISAEIGCGCIVSTTKDIARWAALLYSGKVLSAASTAAMMDLTWTPDHSLQYGLGCFYNEGIGYGHNGAIMGFLSVMRYDPETGIAFAVYMNMIADDIGPLLVTLFEIGLAIKTAQ